jgi:dihydrofolate reductase
LRRLVAGSVQLVQSLLVHDLVDELHLMVFPIVLGRGKRLFADGAVDPERGHENADSGRRPALWPSRRKSRARLPSLPV